ncbi:MAG: PIN domain-containing protein [Planctomycetes bacterium]|nr:PIN domain-containing protein [Planctomycetota bacterium]
MPDNSDDKILECAIAGRCNAILTFNIKDFPKGITDQYNLTAMTPGEFIRYGGLK